MSPGRSVARLFFVIVRYSGDHPDKREIEGAGKERVREYSPCFPYSWLSTQKALMRIITGMMNAAIPKPVVLLSLFLLSRVKSHLLPPASSKKLVWPLLGLTGGMIAYAKNKHLLRPFIIYQDMNMQLRFKVFRGCI